LIVLINRCLFQSISIEVLRAKDFQGKTAKFNQKNQKDPGVTRPELAIGEKEARLELTCPLIPHTPEYES
jgi:hypothetical protein